MLTFGRLASVSKNFTDLRRIDVELGVPACDVVNAAREAIEVFDAGRAAAIQVEPNRANARCVELEYLFVGNRGGHLDDADKSRPERLKRVVHVLRLRALERTCNH